MNSSVKVEEKTLVLFARGMTGYKNQGREIVSKCFKETPIFLPFYICESKLRQKGPDRNRENE